MRLFLLLYAAATKLRRPRYFVYSLDQLNSDDDGGTGGTLYHISLIHLLFFLYRLQSAALN